MEHGISRRVEEHVEAADGSSGQPLPDGLRDRFEASLGADLSGVRIHTGAASRQASASMGARAYALGQDIHFNQGEYAPGSAHGDLLLAHEVAHTVQQAGGVRTKREMTTPGDSVENEADRAADAMVRGEPAQVSRAQGIARQRLPPSMDASVGGMDAAVRPPDPNADPPNPEDGNAQRPYSLGPPPPPPPPPAPIAEPTLDGRDDRPYSMTGEDPDGEWMSGAAVRGERSAPHVPSFSRPQYGTNLAEFFAALESVNQVASRATPLIATYSDAVNDRSLHFMVRDGESGDLNQLALRQPRNADGNGPSIAELFPSGSDHHDLSAGEGQALADAVPRAQAIRHRIVETEGNMETQRSRIEAAALRYRAAGLRYEAEQARGRAVTAEQRAQTAQGEVDRINTRRENWQTGVRIALRVAEIAVAVVAGMPAAGGGGAGAAAAGAEGSAAATTAATATRTSRALSSGRQMVAGLGSNSAHDLLGSLGDAIVNAAFASQLRAAQNTVNNHHDEARRQIEAGRQSDFDAAHREMEAATADVETARREMTTLVTTRRNLLRELSNAVVPQGAQAGNPDAQNARSLISALPAAETVVSRLRAINAVLEQLPAPTRQAQTGAYAMLPAQRTNLRALGQAYSQLRGWHEEFAALEQTWSRRIVSMRVAFHRLDHVDPAMNEQ